jgi:hypothetical protein
LWYIPRQAAPNGLLEKFLFLRWLTVILIPAILLVQILKNGNKKKFVAPMFVIAPIFVLTLIYIFSGIVNNSKFAEIIGSWILYIRYPLLFLALANMDLSEQDYKNFIKVFLILTVLQIPECLYRFFFLGISGDYISWTLGPWGAFDLGVYIIYTTCLVIAYDCVHGFKFLHILFICLLFVLAVLGEIKAFMFTIPLVSLFIIFYYFRSAKVARNIIVWGLPIFTVIIVYYITQIWGSIHKSSGNMLLNYLQLATNIITNPSLLFNPQGLDYTATRFLGSAFVWRYLANNWQMLIYGAGPGSLLAGSFLGTSGKLFDLPNYLNQISVILGEIGIVGLIVYFWLLINLLRMINQYNKTITESDSQIVSLALVGMWVFYALLGPFYDLVWRHDSPNYIFYFLLSYIYNQTTRAKFINSHD